MRESSWFQASDGCKERTRGNAVFSFAFGLVVGEGQRVLEVGVEPGPKAMQKVLAAHRRFANNLPLRFGQRCSLLGDQNLLSRQVNLPGANHNRDGHAQYRNLKFDGHVRTNNTKPKL